MEPHHADSGERFEPDRQGDDGRFLGHGCPPQGGRGDARNGLHLFEDESDALRALGVMPIVEAIRLDLVGADVIADAA